MNKRAYLFTYFLMPISGLSTDIYLPSLPNMVGAFHTMNSMVQLTITAFVLAMGIGQMLAGPMSDALGRRRLIILSLIIQALSLLIIVWASSIYTVIAARFLQGFAVAFMIVPARAILNDVLQGEQLKKHFNYLTICYATAPIVAPFIGGYAQHYFGWQCSFLIILVYVTIMFLVTLLGFRETLAEKKAFEPMHIIHNYKAILSDKTYVGFTLFATVLFGYTAIFNVMGPFVFEKMFALTAIQYGYVALGAGFAWFSGNITNRIFFNADAHTKVNFALWGSTFVSLGMLALSYIGYVNGYIMAITAYLLIYFTALIFPTSVTVCLSLFPKMAGSANACFFSMTWVGFAIYTLFATALEAHSLTEIAIGFVAVNLLSQLIYHGLLKKMNL